jgi:hypothetical protein
VQVALLSAVVVAGCAGLGAAGCADLGATHTPPSKVATAQATHEYPSPSPSQQTTTTAAPGPTQAVDAFASAYINWTADTVSTDLENLSAASVGQARSAMQLAAAQTAHDYELQRGGIANSGTVGAIAPLRGHSDQYVVVTRELTTATATNAYQGLAPAWHLAVATVTELTGGRWVVSGWQPES